MARHAKAKPQRKPAAKAAKGLMSAAADAAPAANGMEEGAMKMKDQTENFAARSAEFAQKGYDQVLGAIREQVEKASLTAFKTYEELSKFQKDNYEAYVSASTILAKGLETVGRTWADFANEQLESAAQTAKALLGAKTLREAVDVQSEWAKASFDRFVAEATKVSEMTVKLANDAMAPISSRANATVEKMMKPVAA